MFYQIKIWLGRHGFIPTSWVAPKIKHVWRDKPLTPKPAQKKKKVKKPQRHSKRKCPVTEKIKRTEKGAKAKAKQFKSYMRAYKCEFCPHWHLTHERN